MRNPPGEREEGSERRGLNPGQQPALHRTFQGMQKSAASAVWDSVLLCMRAETLFGKHVSIAGRADAQHQPEAGVDRQH